jgi:hypothetical protein
MEHHYVQAHPGICAIELRLEGQKAEFTGRPTEADIKKDTYPIVAWRIDTRGLALTFAVPVLPFPVDRRRLLVPLGRDGWVREGASGDFDFFASLQEAEADFLRRAQEEWDDRSRSPRIP